MGKRIAEAAMRLAGKIDRLLPAGFVEKRVSETEKLSCRTDPEEEDSRRRCRLIVGMIFALASCMVLAVAAGVLSNGQDEKRSIIDRPEPGQGALLSKMSVETSDGEISGLIDVPVSERVIYGEKLEEEFVRVEEILGEIIFAEGDSCDCVTRDLTLPDSVPGSPVEIRWSSDRQELVSLSGKVQNGELDEAAAINLTAHLSYRDETRQIRIPIVVAPSQKSEGEIFLAALSADIKRLDSETAGLTEVVLPTRFREREIIWKTPSTNPAPAILLIGLFFCAFLFAADKTKRKDALALREDQMMCDYPEVVDKLSLLVGAGMTIRGAWQRICSDYLAKHSDISGGKERYCYEEMLVAEHALENGVSEERAYGEFGRRCDLPVYRKLGQLLARNVRRGSRTLLPLLEMESRDAFAKRKNYAREQGEKAGTKLLLPMGGMLVMIMAIVVYPAMQSF